MAQSFKVVQYGIGPIGQSCLRTILTKNNHIELVGAIDIDPNKVGKDVSEILGLDAPVGVQVSADAEEVLSRTKPDVVVHTTSSFLARMYDQLVLCAKHGANVISSTEELSYPFDRHPEIAKELDLVARENGVTILGTGVNPGYAMDALALMATGVCNEVRSITINREVDAGLRRLPLQQKVGAGITAEQFAEKKATGMFGHIGLVESIRLIADGLDWSIDRIEEHLDPVISPREVITPFLTVKEGSVAGIHHHAYAYDGEELLLTLDLKMFVGAEDPRDAVKVDGDPPMDLVVRGGIFGDTATVATLINGIPQTFHAQPGLQTVKDVPLVRAFGTR
ncbi:MAG: dihydrodipicolinate reductase [Bacteroidetes bacterium]|nr:dihydrodipicolinate reductase [Bacteroidota bacterium]MDA1333567.1 dihydrodipicolinate reductase [Bacteroidota bacterium]